MPSVSVPTVLAVGSMAATAAGAGVSAYGQSQAGQARSKAAAYQAQVAANNAAIAKQNEELEVQSGEVAAANQGLKTRAVVGKTLSGQSASGVDVNSKSFTDVRAAEAELGNLDALTIRSNAARKAYNYAVAATGDTAQSQLLTMQSEQEKSAGTISALGTFIGGMGSAAGKFAGWQSGVPSAPSGFGSTAEDHDPSLDS